MGKIAEAEQEPGTHPALQFIIVIKLLIVEPASCCCMVDIYCAMCHRLCCCLYDCYCCACCRELVAVDKLSSVRTFTRLFDAMATHENGVNAESGHEALLTMVELWFLFSLIWGLGGSLDEEGRKKFDAFMR